MSKGWVKIQVVDGRPIRKIAGPFDTLEELWEWEHGHIDPREKSWQTELYVHNGQWETMPLKEWEKQQALARKFGPWHDLREGHPCRPWSWACPDCGGAHGRGKGPYGLGIHWCPEGPQDIPGKMKEEERQKRTRRPPIYCAAAVNEYSGSKYRQCRNHVSVKGEYCWTHKNGCLHWESLKNQLPDALRG